jgi:DNA-binding response OmpR family regulator
MLTWKANYPHTSAQVVLIISDLNDVSERWETLLQQKGYTTVQETHENALQTCRVIDPALIVIDTNLPHADRLMFCSKIRAISTKPIILLVPDYKSNDMDEIYSVGVNECLLKPVSPAFLVVKTMSWLLRKHWLEFNPEFSPIYTTP